ncbi:ectoine/hydroxyectoine ABC transporter substrate-binding protein EhuB [Burkholderia cepacia]|uniref:ectoine/hydroxyectoine ABC transporter substrate-binding protein EhuB n=1 Tax=Burkholderia cepacia TaxID=292 RepID=UPI002AB7A3C9|nr:ectoine/hydroxyectoine ABC transporter substrate-binding protein EhuB [Burkholderia cepacia]
MIAATALCLLFASYEVGAQTLKEQVASEGRITIGIHNTWPWGVRTSDGGVSGIHPDVLRAVTEQLGVKKIDFVTMDFGALIPSLLARRIDAVASGMNITPPRCQQVAFSDPFMASGDTVLVKSGNPLKVHSYKDIAQNPKIRVGDMRGASTTPNALAAGISKDQIQLFPDPPSEVAALLSDRVDALLFTKGSALGILRDPNVKGIERATPFQGLVLNGKEQLAYAGIAFRKEDSDFIALFNKVLAQKKADGTIAKILAGYGFASPTDTVPDGITAKTVCGG